MFKRQYIPIAFLVLGLLCGRSCFYPPKHEVSWNRHIASPRCAGKICYHKCYLDFGNTGRESIAQLRFVFRKPLPPKTQLAVVDRALIRQPFKQIADDASTSSYLFENLEPGNTRTLVISFTSPIDDTSDCEGLPDSLELEEGNVEEGSPEWTRLMRVFYGLINFF